MRNSEKKIFFGNIVQSSDIPLYYQLLSIIKRGIKVGVIKTGDILPSEAELCASYNISRSTVRHAVGELEREGLVVRRRGKGTFISEPKLNRKMDEVYSFSKEMRNLGLEPSSKILDFQIIAAQMDLGKSLEMKDRDDAYKIVRVRLANDEPLLVETTFIPVEIVPGLTREMLENKSLYEVIDANTGNTPYEAEESYESIILRKETANLLRCKQNASGFYIERKTRMQDGTVFEWTQSIMRGDRTKFVVKLKNKGIEFNRSIDVK